MDNIERYQHDFSCASRSFSRGGNLMQELLSKEGKFLSGGEALSIFNTYGIATRELKLLLLSHGFEMDEGEFIQLLLDQKDRDSKILLYGN